MKIPVSQVLNPNNTLLKQVDNGTRHRRTATETWLKSCSNTRSRREVLLCLVALHISYQIL
ncbi:hypothetical protein Bca101_025748 [Brassica carinata]